MIYLGNVSDTQTKTHVYNECKNFQDKYPHVDFFGVDRTSVDQISNRIRSSKVVIYYADIPPYTGLDVFFKLFGNFPDTTFYMLTLPADWTGIAEWPKNTHWLHYYFSPHSHTGNDYIGEYRNFQCFTDKNFSSNKVGISLNRLPRSHRLVSLSYMLGIGLDEHCVITAPLLKWHLSLNNFNFDIMNSVSWDFDKHENFKTVMSQGWERAKQSDGLFPVTKDAYPPYDDLVPNQSVFDNPANYANNLMPFYKNSFVEYIMFSIYDYAIPWVCEKLLNSQLGGNFPIIIGGKNSVKWLRDNGFDVFDDIIDHSYDSHTDPVLRLQSAIENNKSLLLNATNTIQLWKNNNYRFKNNVDWYIRTCDNLLLASRKKLHDWLQ